MKNVKTLCSAKAVSISDLRKDIKSYFTDEPVAVLNNNKPIGYLINEDTFKQLMKIVKSKSKRSDGNIYLNEEMLSDLAEKSGKWLDSLTSEDIKNMEFFECE